MGRRRSRARSPIPAGPDSLWAFLVWLGDHGWREWFRITSFVVIAGPMFALIGVASTHLISYLIALLRLLR
jgi:hypothetical protein